MPPWPAWSTNSNRQLVSGGKKKRKLNSQQSPACISSGPAALGKCSSVPCIICLPSLQIPCSSSCNEQMQMWNYLWRVDLCLKRIWRSAALTGVMREWKQKRGRRLVESVEDLIVFADRASRGAKGCSRLPSWGEIVGGTAELPRCNCKWIFIYSGSWDEQGPLGSAVACRAVPRGTN